MTTWREALEAGDPIASDSGLDPETTRRMRAVVLAASEGDERCAWALPVALAVVLSGVIVGGVAAARRVPAFEPTTVARLDSTDVAPPEVRQLQFATAGGTRLIWVFNSAFESREGER